MAGEKTEQLWLAIGYIPAIIFGAEIAGTALIFAGETAWTALRPPSNFQSAPQAKIQIWLQDLVLFPFSYALAMTLGFNPGNLETILFPSVCLAIGFVAALDICAAYGVRAGIRRAAIVFAAMASCIWFAWLGALLWYFERVVRSPKSRSQGLIQPRIQFIIVSVLIYFLSFALPMGRGQPMSSMISSVGFNSFGSINGQLWGFGAYYMSFESFFFRFGSDDIIKPDYTIHFGDGRIPWLANPIFWIAIHFFLERRYAMAAFVGVGACALATGAHGPTPFTLWNSPGYIVWFFSMALPTLAALVMAIRERKNAK
jgi:hypothetical protein